MHRSICIDSDWGHVGDFLVAADDCRHLLAVAGNLLLAGSLEDVKDPLLVLVHCVDCLAAGLVLVFACVREDAPVVD